MLLLVLWWWLHWHDCLLCGLISFVQKKVVDHELSCGPLEDVIVLRDHGERDCQLTQLQVPWCHGIHHDGRWPRGTVQ